MANSGPEREGLPPAFLVDPASLHILLVDANSASRQEIGKLLRDCSYQVTACKTSQEAIQVLKAQQGPQGTAGFDLILKEHSPTSGTNACRFLRRCQTESVLHGIPIIVASTTEDRDVMVSCLQLGAADYMLKPLRHNELRNLWARVYWWRRASYLQQQGASSTASHPPAAPLLSQASGESQETKCCSSEEDEPQNGMVGEERSAEGSAPEDSSQGKRSGKGNDSKNISKEGRWSGTQQKPGTKTSGDGNGNSSTKAGQGSNYPFSDAGQLPSASAAGKGISRAATTGQESHAANPGPAEAALYQPLNAAASNAAATLLQIAPLNVSSGTHNAPSSKAEEEGAPCRENIPRLPSSGASNPRTAFHPPGFRAYVPPENSHKRAAESLPREDGGRSLEADRPASIEKPESVKRRATQSLGGLPMPATSTPSDTTFAQVSQLTGRDELLPKPSGSLQRSDSDLGTASGSWSHLPSCQPPGTAFSSQYPYGMLHSPFAVPPQFWGQLQAGMPTNEPDMQSVFQLAQQVQQQAQGHSKAEQQKNLQQQQMAMHNQLMFQHSLLMQQYGMPAPMFPPVAGFPGSQTPQGPSSSQNANGAQQAAPAKEAPGSLRQPLPREGCVADTQHNAGTPWNPAGAMTGLISSAAPNGKAGLIANGATSHTTAQVGPDGCMVEPSRKERRAQALYKYKQKRKNLCFTKKIRYESRKQLAQARPRVKGQFVRVRSDDIADVAEVLGAQKDGPYSGSAAPRMALGKAHGNVEIAHEIIEAAKQLVDCANADNTEEDESDDDDDFEEDDVNSPAAPPSHASLPAAGSAAQTTKSAGDALTLGIVQNGRHSSDSGSNSPEILAASALV